MTIQEIQSALEKNIPGIKLKSVRDTLLIENPADLLKAAVVMKNSGFDYLSSVTGADYLQYLECVYHFNNPKDRPQNRQCGIITSKIRFVPYKLSFPMISPRMRGQAGYFT